MFIIVVKINGILSILKLSMPLSHEVTFCERNFSLEITGCIRIHGRESELLVRDQDLRGRIYH